MSRERRRLKAERDAHAAALDDADLDRVALDAVCRSAGMAMTEAGPVALVEPLDEVADHMAFDAAVCAAGLTIFLRRRLPDDWPTGFPGCETHILVRQIAKGVRFRLPTWFVPQCAMN